MREIVESKGLEVEGICRVASSRRCISYNSEFNSICEFAVEEILEGIAYPSRGDAQHLPLGRPMWDDDVLLLLHYHYIVRFTISAESSLTSMRKHGHKIW